jgi:ATP-dependent exoDNAse (exonuclease V) alpha subunit
MNDKQLEAIDIIKNRKNLFLTGSAGTGKSYTIREIVRYFENMNINYGLTALTGCAAVLIDGRTIHSFLGLGISRDLNSIIKNLEKYKKQLNIIKNLQALIIDEISMMDNELFELIDKLLKYVKQNDLTFGGIQLVLVGDFYQLPPITNDYCFTSPIWDQLNLSYIILTEIIRQKDDDELKKILEEIRNEKLSNESIDMLKNLVITDKHYDDNEIKPTRLYPINTNVDKINNYEYKKLLKKNDNIEVLYKARTNSKEIIKDIDKYDIKLTLNTQIMVIRNISIENKLVNGTRGIVIELKKTSVIIKDIEGRLHEIEYHCDTNINGKKNIGISFIPLKLAYAISIHKSQGASIDNLEIDLGDDIFISGQLYTALSRSTNIKNLKLINFSVTSLIKNIKIKNFYKKISIYNRNK